MIRLISSIALVVAVSLICLPGFSAAQRGPAYTCDGELPPAFAKKVVLGCSKLADGKDRLTRTEARRIAGTTLQGFLDKTAAEEGRTIANIRPTVYAKHDPRLDAYCGIATFADQSDPSARQTREYNTTIWYLRGGIYLVTVGTGRIHCSQQAVRVRFKSRRVSSKKVASAVAKRYFQRLYGAVKAVRVTGIKSRRPKEGDYYGKVRASFTFVHPDGYEERLKQTVRLVFQDVNKRATWRADLQRVR